MKKLIEMITHNFGWKVLSLLAAVVVWFLIINITNPTRDETIQVMLRIEGVNALRENNIMLYNAEEIESTPVTLTLRGSVLSLAQRNQDLRDGKIYAYIDLSPIDISRRSEFMEHLPIRVRYGTTENYQILHSTPSEVDVKLDRYVTRSFPIIVEKLDDDMQGYISSEPIATPANVVISGPESIVKTVAEVRAAVEVGHATASFDAVSAIELINADGTNISKRRLEMSTEEVGIYVSVNTFARIPVSTPAINGEVAPGYRITSVHPSPREVEVEGHPDDIRALNAIRLMPIDVSGISRTRVETYDIHAYLEGMNLSIREGSESEIRVTVTVEREINKEILVPVEQIEVRGLTEGVRVLPGEVVRLEVQGIASEIVAFENSLLIAYIDVTGRDPGTYQLEVHLQTPDGIRQTGTEAVQVVIEENVEVEEPEDGEITLE